MRTESISRRLAAVEAKLLPRVPPLLQELVANAAFIRILDGANITVEEFLRNGLTALPRDLLRSLVERLRVANAAG